MKKKSSVNRNARNAAEGDSELSDRKDFAENSEGQVDGALNAGGSDSEIDEVVIGFQAALDRLVASRHRDVSASGIGFGSGYVKSSRSQCSQCSQYSQKIPPKLYRVGEMVAYSGVSRQTIHNYTTMGLLREIDWTHGGHRLYDETAFERLDRIAELRGQRRTMDYIRDYLTRRDAGEAV